MIPWFIVNLIAAIAWLFGRDTCVTVRSDRWGADRIHFMPLVPGTPRPRRLAPCRGGALAPGEMLEPVEAHATVAGPADPDPAAWAHAVLGPSGPLFDRG